MPSMACSRGPRRSASMSNMRRPCCFTSTCARFAEVKDLPSFGRALVTRIFFSGIFSRV